MAIKRAIERTSIARLRDEQGMTIVEVTVAAFLLVIVALSTLGVVDSSTRSTFRAEETQTVINIAQREMELLRQLDYDELALTEQPPAGTEANDPTSRIRNENDFCLDRVDGDDPCPTAPAELVVNGGSLEGSLVGGGLIAGGVVEPLSTDIEVGDITVDVYRFVVWQDEGDELLLPTDELCVDKPVHFLCKAQDYKRAVVVVRAQQAAISHERPYEEVQSDFIDPDRATLDAEPLGPTGPEVTAEQFYLSDTDCKIDPGDPPAPSNHPTHNTTGGCLTGTNAPDNLVTDPPLDSNPGNPLIPEFFDYSTDIEPGVCLGDNCDPDDKGLQMLEQVASPCTPAPIGPGAHKQIHRWVSSAIPTGEFVMTDRATLELWTRTIDDVQGVSGKVCAYLFKTVDGLIQTPLATASYADPEWPSGPSWTEVRIDFDLSSVPPADRTLLAGQRLGVSFGIDPAGTSPNVLQFLYDHPEGGSRLEVLTTTPLP